MIEKVAGNTPHLAASSSGGTASECEQRCRLPLCVCVCECVCMPVCLCVCVSVFVLVNCCKSSLWVEFSAANICVVRRPQKRRRKSGIRRAERSKEGNRGGKRIYVSQGGRILRLNNVKGDCRRNKTSASKICEAIWVRRGVRGEWVFLARHYVMQLQQGHC